MVTRGPGRPPSPWEERVFQFLAEDEGRMPSAIRRLLVDWADDLLNSLGADDAARRKLSASVPPPSTIKGIRDRYFAMDPEERVKYGLTRFPESFGGAGLPWDAAPAFVELQTYLDERHRQRLEAGLRAVEVRASVRVTRWYWRVCVASAARSLEPREKLRVAIRLASAEVGMTPDASRERRDAEGTLLGRPLSRPFESFEMRYTASGHDIWMAFEGVEPPTVEQLREAYSDGAR